MEITELAAALPHNYEFILFDCCLMGGIEVAYEFKDKCEYMLFSPTEILADGFPYEKMFDPIFNVENREEALKGMFRLFCHLRCPDRYLPVGNCLHG